MDRDRPFEELSDEEKAEEARAWEAGEEPARNDDGSRVDGQPG